MDSTPANTRMNRQVRELADSLECTYRASKATVVAKRPAGRVVNSFLPIRLNLARNTAKRETYR